MRKPANHRLSLLLSTMLALLPASVLAQNIQASDEPISFRADEVSYDQQADIFVATGHVEVYQDQQIVMADKVTYERANDKVSADGNITLVDKSGQVYFAKHMELQSALKQGFAEDIGLMFTDGSRFVARSVEQPMANTVVLRNAVYSPCSLCATDPRKAPLWQLRASKVVDVRDEEDIYYHNARFEAYGVPVVYLPYFSHPEPQVVSRSGFLEPVLSTDSKTGFMLRQPYYYSLTRDMDATLEVTATQKNSTILGGQWRQRSDRGYVDLSGSGNFSPIRSGSDEKTIIKDEDFRGHFFGRGEFSLTDTWRTGFNIRRTVDRFYLKDFDYSQEDLLNNELYGERLDNRNYTRISGHYFQDLRPNISTKQPQILPWVQDVRYGTPNGLLGGRWGMNSQFINLLREAEPSVSRLSLNPSWKREDITPFGLKTSLEGKARSDTYWVQQDSPYDMTTPGNDPNTTITRLYPSTTLATSYPMVRPSRSVTALIEPKAALTLSPNISQDGTIPNEDSRDVQIDTSNLFEDSRFPGVDRVESGSHVSYGMKMGGYRGSDSLFVTVGQSYSLTDNSLFPEGSGLEKNRSDYVGQVEATFMDKFYLDYRFQLQEEDLASQRQEAQLAVLQDRYEAAINYLSAPAIPGTGLTDSRNQLELNLATRVTDMWSTGINTRHDLSGDAGLLNAGLAVQYRDECFRATLRAERDLTDRLLGGGESRIMFSIGLRNLGGYDTPLLKDRSLFTPFGTRPRL